MPPRSHALIPCVTGTLGHDGTIVLHAHAGYATDPNPLNNDDTRSIYAFAGPDIALLVGTPTIDPGLPFDVGLYWYNASTIYPAANAAVTVTLPAQIRVVSLPANCTQSGQTVTCAAGTIPAGKIYNGQPDITFTAIADDSTNGHIVSITGDIATTTAEGNVSNNHYVDQARVFRTFFAGEIGRAHV